jgi:hypothetical protein
VMNKLLLTATIAGCLGVSSLAYARPAYSGYDGSWDLVFVTQGARAIQPIISP